MRGDPEAPEPADDLVTTIEALAAVCLREEEERAAFRLMDRLAHCIDAVLEIEDTHDAARGDIAIRAAGVQQSANALRRQSAAHAAATLGAVVDPHARARAARAEEFDRILEMHGVAKVAIAHQMLIVTTADVVLSRSGRAHNLGPYEIHIPKAARDASSVTMRSCRGKRTAWGAQHPHVHSDGAVCWGNMSPPVTAALQQGDIDVVVQIAIAVLHTVVGEGYWNIVLQIMGEQPVGGTTGGGGYW
ncbi:hypothetical protein HY480_03800 [Candidatus Uhrbacteria bacterium]|nr:hypothetical protein [Candidatus Uhrbacteria bacterium]